MLKSTLSGYRFLRLAHEFWTPAFRERSLRQGRALVERTFAGRMNADSRSQLRAPSMAGKMLPLLVALNTPGERIPTMWSSERCCPSPNRGRSASRSPFAIAAPGRLRVVWGGNCARWSGMAASLPSRTSRMQSLNVVMVTFVLAVVAAIVGVRKKPIKIRKFDEKDKTVRIRSMTTRWRSSCNNPESCRAPTRRCRRHAEDRAPFAR